MEHVDYLIVNAVVITMNDAFDVFHEGAVAVRGREIVAAGDRGWVEAAYSASHVIDCGGMVVMPGLVNAHTHVPMTLLRGMADDLRLDVWLLAYVMPVERQFVTPEFCRLGTSIACAEMIRSGVTSFADMYYFEDDVAESTAQAGLRGVLGQSVLQFPSPDAETYEDGLWRSRAFIEKWRGHTLITPAVAPHAPYSLPDEVMQRCAALAVEYGVPLLTHLAETRFEVEDSIRQKGASVIRHMHSLGLFEANVLAAHCVHVDGHEIGLLKQGDAGVAHNPTSNLKLASGIAPVAQMLNANVNVGIGTDGPASNNDLDMFEEVRLAALLAKTASNDPTTVPAREALLMATRRGADALFIGDITGSLETGKRADLIAVDLNTLHNLPHFQRDPNAIYAQIVYAAHSADVRHVMCDGRLLMRDRVLLTVDEPQLIEQAATYAREVDAFLALREESLLSKLVAISDLERAESFEVQVKAEIESATVVDRLLRHPSVRIVKHVHYRQYDTYFLFDDAREGRVRYREDDQIDDDGDVQSVRARLTLTMPTVERKFHGSIVLSRSQFMADANRPLRFYREYFRPLSERELEKDRLRWHIDYRGERFYVNLDRVLRPAVDGLFIEIKSRTWSLQDAEQKAEFIREMMAILGVSTDATLVEGYLELQPETE